MTYNFNIDQEFAIVNDLSLVQVSTLAAFMTLPIWSKTVAIDGVVWYQYSDEKMANDFPLLFGIPKRCYKNISELADLGFVELTKLGRTKYVRFTSRCAEWNKQKEGLRTNSPKTDSKESENGLEKSPKMDFPNIDYNINNTDINDKADEGGLFPSEDTIIVTRPKRTSEALCLFENSRYSTFEEFSKCFETEEFRDIDLVYYFHAVADWSASKGAKKRDWIATARNFIRGDMEKGKVRRKEQAEGLSQDAIEYLKLGWHE